MGSQDFPRDARLLTSGDYRRVFTDPDQKASHRYILLLAANNTLGHSRVGIIAAKKHIKLAVSRNHFKRIVRETFRQLDSRQESMDVVVLARQGADRLDNTTLSSILRQQWRKLIES
ncbi:MAG: ribonuclease P protein component [Pseudomonadota bacterium]